MVGIVWHRLQILRRAHANNWTQDSLDTIDQALVIRYPRLVDPFQKPPSLGEDLFLELESRNAYSGAAAHPGLYQQFFAALREIEDAAGNVPLAFLIIPDEYQVENDLWQEVVKRNELPLQRDRPQRLIRDWARIGNRDTLDLLPWMLAVEPLRDGRRHVYHLRDTHFNARGNEIAGKSFARFLETWFVERQQAGTHTVPTKPSAPAVMRLKKIPVEKAVKIVKVYATVIPKVGIDGSVVVDSDSLPFPKYQIMGAAISLIQSATDAAEKESFAEVALTLAFFQSDVGGTPTTLDATNSDGETWRNIVSTEMQNIKRTLDESEL